VPAGIGVERRDAHQPVHAVLALEPAIGVVALHLDGGRLDASFFAACFLQVFDLVAVLLGPARVHAQQHVGPVLALGAAGAGMDFQEAIEAVGLAGQQRLQLAPRHLGLEPLERRFSIGHDVGVVLNLAELDHADVILDLALDAAKRRQLLLQRRALLHQPAGALGIVPQIGIFGEVIQLGEAGARLVEVKDASSAVPGTA
jgi:hypothetical protein